MAGQDNNVNGRMYIPNLSTLLMEIIDNKFNRNSQPEEHDFWLRSLAAFAGSFALHFALLLINTDGLSSESILKDFNIYFVFACALALILFYSSIYALIVAKSRPKGTVIHHFAYGVFLPTFCYSAAGYLKFVIGE